MFLPLEANSQWALVSVSLRVDIRTTRSSELRSIYIMTALGVA